MENNQISEKLRQINSGFDLKRIMGAVISKWYWFVISLILTFTIGFLYLRYTTPLYSIKSLILIEVPKTGVSNLINRLGDGQESSSGTVNSTNLFNEMFVLTSQDLVGMAVDSMDMNIQYWAQGRVREDELYTKSPIKVVFDSLGYLGTGTQEIRLTQLVDGLFEFNEGEIKSRILFDKWIKRPYGTFKILYAKNSDVNKGYLTDQTEIIVRVVPEREAVNRTMALFNVTVSDGRTSLLDLSYTDNIPARGVDFLNTLIYYYRKKELEDLNTAANKTREFIDLQKSNLIAELQSRDSIEEEIKTQNKIIDVKTQATTIMAEKSAQQEKIQQFVFQKQAVQSLKNDVLEGVGSRYEVLAGVNVNDPVLAALITEYNTLVQRKELLERNTAPMHPSLVKAKNDLAALRKNIADACDRIIETLNRNIDNISQNIARYNASMASIPAAERSINNTKREYPLIQGVYLYLYQRGVENDISQYAASNKSKVVVAPYSESAPIKPVKKNIYAMVVLFGLLIPGSVIIGRVMLNNKVISESDIEAITTIPVIGSIAKTTLTEKKQIVVGPHIRTGIAEQFRLIRANLEFMSSGGHKKTYLITSSMSGEGKTFVSINLGITMTLAKKRVVVMEFDLRKPKLSSYLGLHNDGGISSYLAGLAGIEKVIKASGVHENLYIANCGPIPPNPGELLVLPTTRQLIEELQEMFDVIIMDTAPIGLVSDPLILSQYSDINLFIIRQAYTMKEQIRLFDTLYKERKIRNAAIVFNGIEYLRKYGYGYGGGYGYCYQYGSGYYEEDSKSKRSLVDVLFKT